MSQKKTKYGNEDDYDSSFDEDEDGDDSKQHKKAQRHDLAPSPQAGSSRTGGAGAFPHRSNFEDARSRADGFKSSFLGLNAFERHKKLINDYFLYYPGAKKQLLQRDGSRDRNDHDIIKDHHRFIWNDEDDADTWEKQLSKKYYNKLFKEYCICDLSFYKMGKFAMRWRTETEVINGKGQFVCGGRKCENSEDLRSWEVNFAYMEESVKKNAMVKLRLCPECSVKLNHHNSNKDVTKAPKKKKRRRESSKRSSRSSEPLETEEDGTRKIKIEKGTDAESDKPNDNVWKEPVQVADLKSREEEFDDYLDDLFL